MKPNAKHSHFMTACTAALLLAVGSLAMADVTYVDTYDTGITYPGRMDADGGGGIYVVDQPEAMIVQLDATGAVVDSFEIAEIPVGIAVHPTNGNIYVSRRDGAVGVYDATFAELGTLDASPFTMISPNDLAIHPTTGQIFVADSAANQIFVFDAGTGTLAGAWGTTGSGFGAFEQPQAIAIDADLGHVIVADVDNTRVQVFDTAGIFLYKFGYRTLYIGSEQTTWFARSEGVAVDACSNIYVVDALMGTLRIFNSAGTEIDPAFVPPVGYGSGAGELNVPCDVVIDGTTMYIANTNAASIEVYDATCAPAPLRGPGEGGMKGVARVEKTRSGPTLPDNPRVIVDAMNNGAYSKGLDLNRDGRVDEIDLDIAVESFGAGAPADFMDIDFDTQYSTNTYDPPHVIDLRYACGRCHSMNDMPNGMLSAAGQENLCLSCHSSGKLALDTPIGGAFLGSNHAWGVPASNGDVMGPEPGSELDLHTDNGDIRCGTCHNPHENLDGSGYLRFPVGYAQLCSQCHEEAQQWYNAGHADSDSQAFTYPVGPGREACARCHSGFGYIDFTNGVPQEDQSTDMQVISCFVCHAPHGSANPDLLRAYGEVILPGDNVVTDAGVNATCMSCHNGRRAPDDGGTPHYALGGVMLEGINANTFGATILNSAHTDVAGCVDCHMAPTPAAGEPGANKVGGHSYNIIVHDPEDPDFGFENVANACNSVECHGATGELTTVNRMAYGDYDGDGAVEGIQDEVQELMDLLFDAILDTGAIYLGHHPYWDYSNVIDDPPGFLDLVKDCVWNWEYVKNSGSRGVHNTGYAVGVLQISYEALTGTVVPGADLRYVAADFSNTHVAIQSVNGGAPVEAGGPFTVDFTIEDDDGEPIPMDLLNRLQLYVSGPAYNYNRVIPSDGNLAHYAQNGDGSYTYTSADPFPLVYAEPLNDSNAFGMSDGELTGQPLLEGTYTVAIESRRVFGSIRKAGDATLDFVVADDPFNPPALAPRQFVQRDVCNNCHNDLQLHGSNRFAVTGCVLCHTVGSEDRVTNPESTPGLTIKFSEMIHTLHRGSDMPYVRATENGTDPWRYEIIGFGNSVNDFSDVGFPSIPKGVMECAACHGGAAQADEIYTSISSITQANCVSCHQDLDFATGSVLDFSIPDVADGLLTRDQLDDPNYRDDMGHTWAAGSCLGCHGTGSPLGVEVIHQHPTDPEQEGTMPFVEIVSVGGMTGGGGAYFVAGDFPEVTFRIGDMNNAQMELLDGDTSIVDRLELRMVGPTTLYQTIIETQRPWSGGSLATDPGNWIDNYAVDGTYTYIFDDPIPAEYIPQANAVGEPPADLIYSYEGGWGQLYTPGGTPLDNGTYSIFAWGRRLTPTDGEREPVQGDQFDILFGADEPTTPYSGTVSREACNACHGVLALHGNQREGVITCMACHTAGSQDGGTYESVDLRRMVHKMHNARNLWVVTDGSGYFLNGHSGITDFSDLLISSMPGEAAECHVCHVTDDWKNPPLRDNMRTWMVACTSCHDSPDVADHVDMMTISGTFTELCVNCHGPGRLFSVETVHAAP